MQSALRLMAALGAVAAPGLFAQMALVQSAEAQSFPALAYRSAAYAQPGYAPAPDPALAQPGRALPPPPYARSGQTYGQAASRTPVPTYDRYGGATSHSSIQRRQAGQAQAVAGDGRSASSYAGARLSWSGKVDAAPAPAPRLAYARYANAQPTAPSSRPAYAPPPVAAPVQPVMPPPPAGWSYVPPIGPAPVEPPAPRSIYDTPPPASASASTVPAMPAAPVQQARAGDAPAVTGGRHYSVHREYGMDPDPIPLPPQFFGATADLTRPETPEPIRRTVTADGQSHNPIQPADGQ